MNTYLLSVLISVALLCACDVNSSRQGGQASASGSPLALTLPAGKTVGLSRSNGDALYSFERINYNRDVLFKQPVTIEPGASITFAGWAVDQTHKSISSGVDVLIDGRPFIADYGGTRDDVASYFKIPAYRDSGFRLGVPAGVIGKGHHEVAIRVISNDGTTYWEGAKVVVNVQ